MNTLYIKNIRVAEEALNLIRQLQDTLEKRINLTQYSSDIQSVNITNNLVQRLALIAGLSLDYKRNLSEIEKEHLNMRVKLHDTVFTKNNFSALWTALLKIRYRKINIDWNSTGIQSRIISYEMLKGAEYLINEKKIDDWLLNTADWIAGASLQNNIPRLNIQIGEYEGNLPALLDLNGLNILNNQILISGSSGSGKTNLLNVIMHELRKNSIETALPVNFLLFDYKGDFSDKQNSRWLDLLEVNKNAIIDLVKEPLPFSAFNDFQNRPQTEINFYATEISEALRAIDKATISANMANRLAKAVISAYKKTAQKPITFEQTLKEYTDLQPEKDKDKIDTIKSLLEQLIRNEIFESNDKVNLLDSCYILKLDKFPKGGVLAKAIVYFTVSKINNIFESLPPQQKNDECVHIRHFTIIDEAHFMIDFDNKPLRSLISQGRSKGLSVLLATQDMSSFKSEHFNFYTNAEYPLIMKHQTLNDKIIKDLFAVSGNEFNEIKEAISNLQKGEVIIKDKTTGGLGIGKKYKKILVTHLI